VRGVPGNRYPYRDRRPLRPPSRPPFSQHPNIDNGALYQVVIDTNVLVATLLSNRGASHRLLRLVGNPRWRINLSVPLVLEYEQTLKRVCTGGAICRACCPVSVPHSFHGLGEAE
jgi:PIN domain